jgi:hypothetical protein
MTGPDERDEDHNERDDFCYGKKYPSAVIDQDEDDRTWGNRLDGVNDQPFNHEG